jgi:hypothetical protein
MRLNNRGLVEQDLSDPDRGAGAEAPGVMSR